MKINITASAFLLLFMLSVVEASKAQDTTLPQGSSHIYLYSGKEKKHVRLWKIDTLKVEYISDGNLGDVRTSDIKKIETPYNLITFDEKNKMLKRHYDFIIPTYYKDTIWCIIENVDEYEILYLPVGSNTNKSISKSSVLTYLQRQEQKPDTTSLKGEDKNNSTLQGGGQDDYYVPKKKAEGDVTKSEKGNYYEIGKRDGKKYFKGKGAKVGGIVSGILFIPYGWISVGIIAAIPPRLANPENPNNGLLYTNKAYHDGFKRGAHGKKVGKTFAGFGIGVGIDVIIVIIAVAIAAGSL